MPMICVLGVAKIGGVALGLRLGSISPVASGTSKNNGTFERQKKKQLQQLMEAPLLLLDLQLLLLQARTSNIDVKMGVDRVALN